MLNKIPFTFASEKHVSLLIYSADSHCMSETKELDVLNDINKKCCFLHWSAYNKDNLAQRAGKCHAK